MNGKSSERTKYNRLYLELVDAITSGRLPYNSKLPSEAELCARCGVSRQTVRNALMLLREGNYIHSVKGSGSYVSRQVRGAENKVLVLFSSLRNYITADILTGIERVLSARGYELQTEFTHGHIATERRLLQTVCENPVSGVIIEGSKSSFPTPNDDVFRKLRAMNIPCVFVNGYYPNVPCDAVIWNDEQIAYKLTSHLIQRGNRSIACMFRFDEMQGVQRYLGYIRALLEADIGVNENLICWFSVQDDFAESQERQNEMIARFIDHMAGNCTALVCYNDQIAGTVVTQLMKRDVRILERISIVSFDNSDLIQFFALKDFYSFSHPKARLGEATAERLLSLIDNPRQEPQIATIISEEEPPARASAKSGKRPGQAQA